MGAERGGRVVRGCVRSINQVLTWEESRERAEVARQAVRGLEAGCLGGVGEGQGEPGRARGGWGVAGGFGSDLKNNLYKAWNRMSSGSYFPPPVRAVEILKPHGGGTRILGVPGVGDRVAQTVVAGVLEARAEPLFHPGSYGYRPGRGALDAVAACRQRCWKTDWVIDLDIAKFFDTVPWDLVVRAVQAVCDLPWVLLYVKRWLAAPLVLPDGSVQQRDRGTPQGSAVSPILANLFCAMRSVPGWRGSSPASGSSATWMMRWCTASARPRPTRCWPRLGNGCARSAWRCIPKRPGSCVRHARRERGWHVDRRPRSMRCCVEDEGLLALRRRPSGGGVKPPYAALAEDRRGER
jgi:Reverse transcriptase (RNA-dependent DNA polymerase)